MGASQLYSQANKQGLNGSQIPYNEQKDFLTNDTVAKGSITPNGTSYQQYNRKNPSNTYSKISQKSPDVIRANSSQNPSSSIHSKHQVISNIIEHNLAIKLRKQKQNTQILQNNGINLDNQYLIRNESEYNNNKTPEKFRNDQKILNQSVDFDKNNISGNQQSNVNKLKNSYALGEYIDLRENQINQDFDEDLKKQFNGIVINNNVQNIRNPNKQQKYNRQNKTQQSQNFMIEGSEKQKVGGGNFSSRKIIQQNFQTNNPTQKGQNLLAQQYNTEHQNDRINNFVAIQQNDSMYQQNGNTNNQQKRQTSPNKKILSQQYSKHNQGQQNDYYDSCQNLENEKIDKIFQRQYSEVQNYQMNKNIYYTENQNIKIKEGVNHHHQRYSTSATKQLQKKNENGKPLSKLEQEKNNQKMDKITSQVTNNQYMDPLKIQQQQRKLKIFKNKSKMSIQNVSDLASSTQKQGRSQNFDKKSVTSTKTQQSMIITHKKSKEQSSPLKLKSEIKKNRIKNLDDEEENCAEEELDQVGKLKQTKPYSNQFLDDEKSEISVESFEEGAIDDDFDDDMDDSFDSTTASTKNDLYKNSQKNILLLNSIYENRPATVFFQYPTQCEMVRNTSRTKDITQFEEGKFKLSFKHISSGNPYKCITRSFAAAGFEETEYDDFNVCWGFSKKPIKNFGKYQKTNHFPGCWHLGRKDWLWRNLVKYKRKYPKDFGFIPNTYILSSGTDWERFQTAKELAGKKDLWILKPASQACGRGIKMLSKKSNLKKKKDYVISDYIANPHLINGLKYDLRLYVLVSSFDPLRIYLFPHGLARFATEKYTTNSKQLSKRFVHLTNYSVNKNSTKYVKNNKSGDDDNSNKWSLDKLIAKYKEMGIDTDQLFVKIKDMIVKTIVAVESNMLDIDTKSQEHRQNCFELYGFDVLIDNKLEPWLLEVNVQPSLSSGSPLDRKIKHMLLSDILNLVGIIPFDKQKYKEDQKKKKNGEGIANKRESVFASKNIKDLEDLNKNNCIQKLQPNDFNILFETDEEFHRKGQWERIFPVKYDDKQNQINNPYFNNNNTNNNQHQKRFSLQNQNMQLQQNQHQNKYFQYFEYQRYNNVLVDKWLNSPHNFLEQIIKKISSTCV